MKNQLYDDPDWENPDRPEPADPDSFESDCDIFSYADEAHDDEYDLPEEPAEQGKGKRKKSAEMLLLENEFLALYEEYIHPTKEYSECRVSWQLDDLCAILMKLNRGWAYRTAQRYKLSGCDDADGEDALAISIEYIYLLLKEDRAAKNYCSYPIAHYLRIAHNKAIDNYFRKLKSQQNISLDAQRSEDDSSQLGEVLPEASHNPFANWVRPRWERDEKSSRLTVMFLRELMDYPDDPPKPLALMYGNVLFQLYKDYGGKDTLSTMAKKSTKVSSPEWAHQRMGMATLLQLGAYAERVVQKCFSNDLTWGSGFNQHMLERTADGSQRKWADIIYTQAYTLGNTSNWIESIMKSTMTKCSRKMADQPELREYAIETLGNGNKFRKALERMEKEDCR